MFSPVTRFYSTRQIANETMNKTRIAAMEMLKKRVEAKSKKPTGPLNSADIVILGNDHLGFKPGILVSSEGYSYMFNCSSGLQRLSYMHRIRLHRCENVFLTNRRWENMSGAFGLALTFQDIGAPSLTIHSTDGISGLFDAGKRFTTFNTGMVCSEVKAKEYKDDCIHIVPIPLDDSRAKASPVDGDIETSKRTKLNARLISYLCTLPDLPGALDPLKCKELKVPVGPLLAKLKSGQDVQLADGTVITSSQVCSPKTRGHKFLIVECPNTNELDSLITNAQLGATSKQRLETDGQQIDFILHLSPSDVFQSSQYQNWMQGFPDGCKHFQISNEDSKVANFIECYRFAYLMNKLDDRIFPLLHLPENLKNKPLSELLSSRSSKTSDTDPNYADDIDETDNYTFTEIGELGHLDRVTNLNSLDKITIRPKQILEAVDIDNTLNARLRLAQLNPHFQEELDTLHKLQSSCPEAKDYEPELVFLGTGSAIPSKLRNTSFILMNFKCPREVSVIMDCGEDSYGQLLRHYGPNESARILRQLDLIYISHKHADHHVGLIDLLRHRKKLTDRRVTLLLPPGLGDLIEYYNDNFEDLRDSYKVYKTKQLRSTPKVGPDSDITRSLKATICNDLDSLVNKIDIVAVDHCPDATAVVVHFNINHPNMKKFVVGYSGDARPSEEFAMIGKDCDLLIHEATFDDRSQQDALFKKHCTSVEAIRMGKSMNAKFTILTHFSQRISKIPYFTDNFDERVGFAFDNLSLKCPSHFPRLPIMKPILTQVFRKDLDDIDLKYLKAELRSKAINAAIESELER